MQFYFDIVKFLSITLVVIVTFFEMSIISRIEEVRKSEGMSMRMFERECGIPNGLISLAIKGYNDFTEGKRSSEPSFNLSSIEKILHRFKLSANWLILGVGAKKIEDMQNVTEPMNPYGLKVLVESLSEEVSQQKKANADLEKSVVRLKMKCIENDIDISDV